MDIVEIPTVVLFCLFQGFMVAGLQWPRPSLRQIEQSSSSGKFREQHKEPVLHLDVARLQEPVILLDLSTLQRPVLQYVWFADGKCNVVR